MSSRILVTYATQTGYTKGVAETIAGTLSEHGLAVEILPMKDVTDLVPYQAVIAGSALQAKQWLPEATDFIKSHQSELARKTFAFFSVCMTLAMAKGESFRPQIGEWLAPVRQLVKPISEGLFAGGLDIKKIPSGSDRLKFRISVILGVWKEGDHRNREAIREWAVSLLPVLSDTQR